LVVRGIHLSRSTLQRRLAQGVHAGLIAQSGQTKGRVYRAITPRIQAQPIANLDTDGNLETYTHTIPLSPEGLEIRNHIRQPLSERPAASYQRSMVDVYRPNVDCYLTPAQRVDLHRQGSTGAAQPAGTYVRHIFDRLLVDLSWASSKLEGNTYTLLDTQNLVEHGKAAQGKDTVETQMVLNHKAAIEMLIDGAQETGFNRYTLFNLHAILSDNLLPDPMASGRLRTREVRIHSTSYVPLGVPQQLSDAFDAVLGKAAQIRDPFEQAFFAMVHLPYLQAFEDVNKRVSRLAANIPLIKNNLCPLSFVDVPQTAYIEGLLGVYELQRIELLRDVFIWSYDRSCQRYLNIRQTVAEPDAFRLKARDAIQKTVQAVVRGNLRGTTEEVSKIGREWLSGVDIQSLCEVVAVDLDHLYEGNVARYRLKLSELGAWEFKRSKNA
jgi:hypothetical protein